jgi:uncharacterized phage-associated protein
MNKSALYSADKIAKYFIWKASQEGKKITNKKLQKLLYYAQAWNLAVKNRPLFKEDIEAWVHGPTIRNIYDQYKTFGFGTITEKVDPKDIKELSKDELLGEVWKVYGKFDAEYLEMLTHNELPWQEAREGINEGIPSTNVISLETMRDYYKERLQHAAA